ncbi:hypothetical protein ACFQJD_18565 [Haloplanus sp. GCM10025708]|uniref:hypothetical protein n=1 Tax=Haloferacaceae TaxID=1644056 RepID=UPI0036114162
MERRSLLALLASTALAGCSSGGLSGDDGGGGSPENGGDGSSPAINDRTLTDTGECANPETATVTFESSHVDITGCITGPNGCSTAILGSATTEGDELRVVVDTDDAPPPGGGCTQALVQRGYDARISFDGGLPASVTVVHESARGREVATRADRP